jgi:ketosteroid isomerase-like protein
VASYGKYVTIWKKQRSGAWRVALDIGNASPAPEPKK